MVKNSVTIQGARIIFRDFSGEKNQYNNDRTFCVVLEEELAQRMKEDGWKVRFLEPRNEDETGLYFIQVKVNLESKIKPQIMMITKDKHGRPVKNELTAETIHLLDFARFENVDVKFRPYNYDVRGISGVKAYLSCLWVTIAEDELEAKYKDVPYAGEGEDEGDAGFGEEEGLPFN